MRTPLFVCNIGHEVALEAGDPLYYTPPRIIRQMRSALWSLPLWATPLWLEDATWWVHPFGKSLSPYRTDRELSRNHTLGTRAKLGAQPGEALWNKCWRGV